MSLFLVNVSGMRPQSRFFSQPLMIMALWVQRRATKMIPGLKNLLYEGRLKRLDMFSLRRRRLRDGMIEMFKMIQSIDKVNLGKLFCIDEDGRTRNHSLCLKLRSH